MFAGSVEIGDESLRAPANAAGRPELQDVLVARKVGAENKKAALVAREGDSSSPIKVWQELECLSSNFWKTDGEDGVGGPR